MNENAPIRAEHTASEAPHSIASTPAVPPTARVAPRAISLTWLLPLASLVLAGAIVYKATRERGIPITITFNEASGLAPGDAVVCRGVRVGTVRDVSLTRDLAGVIVSAEIDRDARAVAVEGSRFWVTRAELSLRGASGLDTLLGPKYVEVEPPARGAPTGEAGAPSPSARAPKPAWTFAGKDGPPDAMSLPAPLADDGALLITVRTPRRGAVGVGSPILYRDVRIGEVRSYRLSGDSTTVEFVCGIEPNYRALVREESKFWQLGGVGVDWGIFKGLTVESGSIETILTGGFALATPEKRAGGPVTPGHVFDAAATPEPEWLKWAPAIEIERAAVDDAASGPGQ